MASKISIYIPFFKGLRYLADAVDSVLAQSNPNWQLTIMDDCGPQSDAAYSWLSAKKDERIHYLRHPANKGMVGNWNSCLDHAAKEGFKEELARCNGPLVTLLHDDDRLLPNYVELMLNENQIMPSAALYFCGADIINHSGQSSFSFPDVIKKFIAPKKEAFILEGGKGFEALLSGCFIMCPTVCYNLAIMGNSRFAEGFKQVQDLELYLRLLANGFKLKGLTQIAYAYRRHTNNATAIQTQTLLRFEEEVQLYDEWAERLLELGHHQAAAIARRKRIIFLNLIYCILKDTLSLSLNDARNKLQFLAKASSFISPPQRIGGTQQ